MDPSPSRRSRPDRVLVGIVILALALRLYRLDAQSLWFDEVLTYLAARDPLSELISLRSWQARMHVLYYLIVHAALSLGGSEAILRLPSVLFGALSVPLVYAATARWIGSRAGLATALLLAVSPFHLYYSQEARPYAALLFFGLLSLVCLQRLAAEPERRGWRVGFVLATAAALYCHPVALAFVAFEALYAAVVARPGQRAGWALTFAAVLIVWAPALGRILVHAGPRTTNPADPVGPFHPLYAMWTFAAGFSLGPSVRDLHSPDRVAAVLPHLRAVATVALLFTALGAAGAWAVWREERAKLALLAGWIVVPIAFLALGSSTTRYPFNSRYVILALPPFLALVAHGALRLPRGGVRALGWALLLVVNAFALWNYYFDPRYERDDYRAAAEALAANASPGDLVVVHAPFTRTMLEYYDPGPVEAVAYPRPRQRIDWGRVQADFDRLTDGRERFWVLLSRTSRGDPTGRLVRFLDRTFVRMGGRAWPGTRLLLYSVAPGAGEASLSKADR